MFILNPHSGVPLYRQLCEQIRRMTASGQLPPGTALPSIRDLALRHAINPMTVSKVYTLLEAEGLLERNRGRRMTVAHVQHAKAPTTKRLQQLEAPLEQLVLAAKQLELGEAEVVKALRSQWEKNDERSLRRRTQPK